MSDWQGFAFDVAKDFVGLSITNDALRVENAKLKEHLEAAQRTCERYAADVLSLEEECHWALNQRDGLRLELDRVKGLACEARQHLNGVE